MVKYRLLLASITFAVVKNGCTVALTLAAVKYRFPLVSITLAVVNKGVTALTTLAFVKYKLIPSTKFAVVKLLIVKTVLATFASKDTFADPAVSAN